MTKWKRTRTADTDQTMLHIYRGVLYAWTEQTHPKCVKIVHQRRCRLTKVYLLFQHQEKKQKRSTTIRNTTCFLCHLALDTWRRQMNQFYYVRNKIIWTLPTTNTLTHIVKEIIINKAELEPRADQPITADTRSLSKHSYLYWAWSSRYLLARVVMAQLVPLHLSDCFMAFSILSVINSWFFSMFMMLWDPLHHIKTQQRVWSHSQGWSGFGDNTKNTKHNCLQAVQQEN